MRMGKTHHKLSAIERERIAVCLSQKLSKREIAKRLGRSDSTIRSEIARHHFGEHYIAVRAQARSQETKSKASKRHPLKNKSVYKFTLKKLKCGWSPEQISGRLKLEHPNNPYWQIHHETIYRFIYAKENQSKNLFEYLPRKQKRRKQKYGRTAHKSRIPDRISIHDRPSEIELRQTFGHWEGDSVAGRAHRGGMHTEVERKTRFIMAQLIASLSAADTVNAVNSMFEDLPKAAKLSTTLDNGKEFVKHKQFDIKTYFADPYSSWQRGTNENSNGLIRRYLPKRTDLSLLTQAELDDIIWEINNRPRKCLGFYTSQEMFEKELQITSARIQLRM